MSSVWAMRRRAARPATRTGIWTLAPSPAWPSCVKDGRGRPIPAWVCVICPMARPARPGYRTDDYLYLPLGVTARTNVASHVALSVNLEFDLLIHGRQQTRDS